LSEKIQKLSRIRLAVENFSGLPKPITVILTPDKDKIILYANEAFQKNPIFLDLEQGIA
jgi:hypothetical protein